MSLRSLNNHNKQSVIRQVIKLLLISQKDYAFLSTYFFLSSLFYLFFSPLFLFSFLFAITLVAIFFVYSLIINNRTAFKIAPLGQFHGLGRLFDMKKLNSIHKVIKYLTFILFLLFRTEILFKFDGSFVQTSAQANRLSVRDNYIID